MQQQAVDPRAGARRQVRANAIRPGDYLPPQMALHGSRWQDHGFAVGPQAHDVRADLPVVSGKVLLFGPGGLLDTIARTQVVLVERAGDGTPPAPAPASEQ